MRLLNAHFIGLKGIYNKSRVKEISIDFTKCIHNMVMIIGKNGYGKSTLIEVLNPLPDAPSMYLDGMDGLKEISYIDNGDVYKITIRYPITSNGQRGQTKAFIQEIHSDGSFIELNPNGNIGSFKEVLYSRFNLDPSFMSLSKLSIENRGIVDKKPSERKKYVALQLESTEDVIDIDLKGLFSKKIQPTIADLYVTLSKTDQTMFSDSFFKIISPVSIPSSIYIVVIPVSLSPFKTDHCIGAAPLYLGKREPCTLIQPYFGISNISFGSIFP